MLLYNRRDGIGLFVVVAFWWSCFGWCKSCCWCCLITAIKIKCCMVIDGYITLRLIIVVVGNLIHRYGYVFTVLMTTVLMKHSTLGLIQNNIYARWLRWMDDRSLCIGALIATAKTLSHVGIGSNIFWISNGWRGYLLKNWGNFINCLC